MGQKRTYQQFSGARVMFQRLRDASLFNGWAERFDGTHLSISVSTEKAMLSGDVCQFEICGFGAKAIFQAALSDVGLASVNSDCDVVALGGGSFLHVKVASLHFEVCGQVRIMPSSEAARLRASGLSLRVLDNEGNFSNGSILDMSANGVAISTEVEMPAKEGLRFVIETHLGPICGLGEVRYCRIDRSVPGYFRVGVKFGNLGRIDGPRWQRLITESA
jgi:hypothetical protein